MRDIKDILHFRSDISPFLVHLTRKASNGLSANKVLRKIIRERQLLAGSNEVSDARFGTYTADMNPEDRRKFFGAVCFTETPVNEIHCLLEIEGRSVNLQPYGLVFVKDRCVERGVDPVIYFNNKNGEKVRAIKALCSLIRTKPNEAAELLPLVALFGQKLTPPGAVEVEGEVDFRGTRVAVYP